MDLTKIILNNEMDITFKCKYLVSKIKELNCSVFLDETGYMHFIYNLSIENYIHISSIQFDSIKQNHINVSSAQSKAINLKEKDEAFLKMMETFLNTLLSPMERILFYEVYFLNHSVKEISIKTYHCESKIRKEVKCLNQRLNTYLSRNS